MACSAVEPSWAAQSLQVSAVLVENSTSRGIRDGYRSERMTNHVCIE